MGTPTRRLRIPVAGCLGNQIMEHSKDVYETLVKIFLNLTQKHIELTLTGYSIIVNGSGKKLNELFMVQK